MKKKLVILLFLVNSFILLSAENGKIQQAAAYAEKGIWELAGNGSFSAKFYQSHKEYEINITPGVSYFFFRRMHAGIRTMLSYIISNSDFSDKRHHFYHSIDFLSVGYVFKLRDQFYLDLAADYGITISKSEEPFNYLFTTALKYDLNPALIQLNLTYRYIDYKERSIMSDYSELNLGLGISIYL